MVDKPRSLNLAKLLIVGISVCLLECVCLIVLYSNYEREYGSQMPIRSLRITIDKSQRGLLFDQLRKFSKKHSFEYELTDFNTNGENFQFWMSRDDIFITASNVPPDPSLVYVRFYIYPGSTIDEETIDDLVTDLKSYISEIQDVTITEETRR